MNEPRRKDIRRHEALLEACKPLAEQLAAKLLEISEGYEAIRDEEQEYRDNIPESMQDGEKAQNSDAAIEALEDLISQLDEHKDALEFFASVIDELVQKSDEAKGTD